MKQLFLLAIMGLLSGCATTGTMTLVPRMPFPENEYLALAKSGTATVKGQAFLKTRGGDVKSAAGEDVILNPVTSYSLEWYEKSYLPSKAMVPPDARLASYVTKQIADGSGRFTFKNVPPGDYFVTTKVTWEAPESFLGSVYLQTQGGYITKRISVKDGDEIDIIITR